jgi:hypothetical protein
LGLAERFLATDLRRGLRNAYRLKNDLSVFLLLPALWFQARGRELGKRESFEALPGAVSAEAMDAWRRASEVREAWAYEEPALHGWARRLWPTPFLPAALDARAARAPGPGIRALLDGEFFARAKEAVRELLGRECDDAGKRAGARDAVA